MFVTELSVHDAKLLYQSVTCIRRTEQNGMGVFSIIFELIIIRNDFYSLAGRKICASARMNAMVNSHLPAIIIIRHINSKTNFPFGYTSLLFNTMNIFLQTVFSKWNRFDSLHDFISDIRVLHDKQIWCISVRLSDRSKVTQNKINFSAICWAGDFWSELCLFHASLHLLDFVHF